MVSAFQASVERPTRRAPPDRVDALLRDGKSPDYIAEALKLQKSYVLERLKLVRLDKTGQGFDVTTSRFARHDEHVDAVLAEGGYQVRDVKSGRWIGPDGREWRHIRTV